MMRLSLRLPGRETSAQTSAECGLWKSGWGGGRWGHGRNVFVQSTTCVVLRAREEKPIGLKRIHYPVMPRKSHTATFQPQLDLVTFVASTDSQHHW